MAIYNKSKRGFPAREVRAVLLEIFESPCSRGSIRAYRGVRSARIGYVHSGGSGCLIFLGALPLRPYFFSLAINCKVVSALVGRGRHNCSLSGFSSQSSFFFPSPRPSLSFSRCLGAFAPKNPVGCWGVIFK